MDKDYTDKTLSDCVNESTTDFIELIAIMADKIDTLEKAVQALEKRLKNTIVLDVKPSFSVISNAVKS